MLHFTPYHMSDTQDPGVCKQGTISCVISEIIPVEASETDILERAASVNYLTDFSVTRALVKEAKARGLQPLPSTKFESIPGKGAKATIYGMEVRVGSPKFLVEERIAVPVSFADKITLLAREGKIVLVVLSGRSLSGAIILSEVCVPAEIVTPRNAQKEASSVYRRVLPIIAILFGVAVAIFLWR